MAAVGEGLVALLILASAFFLFVGSFGLAVLPDMMRRLHAPTKATTLGIGGLLIASMVLFGFGTGEVSLREPVVTLFLLLTAPVSAQMLAKAHLLRHPDERAALPPTGTDALWATEPTRAADEREA